MRCTTPAYGSAAPPSTFSRLVLPAPLRPTRPTLSRARIEKLAPSRMTVPPTSTASSRTCSTRPCSQARADQGELVRLAADARRPPSNGLRLLRGGARPRCGARPAPRRRSGPTAPAASRSAAARNVVGALRAAGDRGDPRPPARRRPRPGAAAARCWRRPRPPRYQLCFFGGVRLAGVAIGTVVGVGSARCGAAWSAGSAAASAPAAAGRVATALALARRRPPGHHDQRRRARRPARASPSRSGPASATRCSRCGRRT